MLIGGGAGGSASGATNALITPVQFLNLYGRVGGSEGSEAMPTFSDGLGGIFSVAPFLPLHISMQAGKIIRGWM